MRSFFKLLGWLSLAVAAACSGGGGSSSSTGGGTYTATVSGVVASGAPVAGSTVIIRDINGGTRTSTTDCSGSFSVNVTGLTPPFLAQTTFIDYFGAQRTLYSYGSAGILNINPMTTAAVSAAAGTSTISYNLGTQTALRNNIAGALSTLREKLAVLLIPHGAAALDPFTDSYNLGTGLDGFFQTVSLTVAGTTLTVKNAFDGSVIAAAPLYNLQGLAVDPNAVTVLNNGHIHIASMSMTTGTMGGHFILTGTGFDPDPAGNFVLVGGLPATSAPLTNGAGTTIGLDVTVPVSCYVGPTRVVVMNRLATGFPEMGEAPSTFTVVQGYDYIISAVDVSSGLIKVTGYFPQGEVVTVTVLQDRNTYNFRVGAARSLITLPLPLSMNPTSPFSVTVTNGVKISNTFVATP